MSAIFEWQKKKWSKTEMPDLEQYNLKPFFVYEWK